MSEPEDKATTSTASTSGAGVQLTAQTPATSASPVTAGATSTTTTTTTTTATTTSSPWRPNQELYKTLINMGITQNAAEKGLYYTGNQSADLAATWIFEHHHKNLDNTTLQEEIALLAEEDAEGDEEDEAEYIKMIFVVNMELGMGAGKIASQCAHAALGMHRILLEEQDRYREQMLIWEELGEKKITLKGQNSTHLKALQDKATAMGLPSYVVNDAGKTQVAAGVLTALCVFGNEIMVDAVTGSLKLL